MNPEIKQRWVEALRSGEYEQGRQGLMHIIEDNGGERRVYCCLGVLCEINGWLDQRYVPEIDVHIHHEDLPVEMLNWLGIQPAEQDLLIDMNDGLRVEQRGFPQIADWIEEHL